MESKKLLSIVRVRDGGENIPLSILGDQSNPKLFYGNGTLLTEGPKNKYRPIHCSELLRKLQLRGWNMTEKKYLSSIKDEENSVIYRARKTIEDDSVISTIDTDESAGGYSYKVVDDDSTFDGINYIREQFEGQLEILNKIMGTDLLFFNTSKKVIDFLTDSVVINLVTTDHYTNVLDLNKLLISSVNKNTSCKIDISLEYTKSTDPEVIYSHSTTFEGFNYENSKLNRSNFIEEVESCVAIEYIDGVLRVIPIALEINECIISNCTVTYGNLKQ